MRSIEGLILQNNLRNNSIHAQRHMVSEVQKCLRTQLFTDMSLSVFRDGTLISYRCHKLVLGGCSSYMREILSDREEDDVSITLDDTSNQELEHLIAYLYSGWVNFECEKDCDAFLRLLSTLAIDSSHLLSPITPQSNEKEVTEMHVNAATTTTTTTTSISEDLLVLNEDFLSGKNFCDDDDVMLFPQPFWAPQEGDIAAASGCLADPSFLSQNDCWTLADSGDLLLTTVDKSAILYQPFESPKSTLTAAAEKTFQTECLLSQGDKENKCFLDLNANSVSGNQLDSEISKINLIQTCKEKKKNRSSKKNSPYHECSFCQKHFPTKHYLRFHENSVHKKSELLTCHLCDKIFSGHYYLRLHNKRMHSVSRPFNCSICGSSFSVKYDLVVHIRTHDRVKQHQCSTCSKTYSTNRALKEHTRTHTGERPYMCKDCGKRFALAKTLRVHFRQHSGERPYLCSHCGKTFVQNSTLKNHLKNHHLMGKGES